MQQLMASDSHYQQDVNRRERDEALHSLNKSLYLPEVNFIYKSYLNDISREEDKISNTLVQESTTIAENDKRWQIELRKNFFPKDFDDSDDKIGSSLDILESRTEMLLSRIESQSDIITDFITWFEAEEMLPLLQLELKMLKQDNLKLSYLQEQNINSPEKLIDNLEELEKAETDYYDYEKLIGSMQVKYNLDLAVFIGSYRQYMAQELQPDTLNFVSQCRKINDNMRDSARKLEKSISRSKVISFLPEITTSLSYNWRNTQQDWDISIAEEKSIWNRTQIEEYPELTIEFSLPLNVYTNNQSKLHVLRNYEHKLNFCQQEYSTLLSEMQNKRLGRLSETEARLNTRQQIYLLYEELYNTTRSKMVAEPAILGNTPQTLLSKAEIKFKKALLKYQKAQMNYYQEVFLINNFGDSQE